MDIDHHRYMGYALEEAEKAFICREVPVGAIVVYEGIVIGRGFNRREFLQNPIAHAEMLAIEEASHVLKSWRLERTILYVTLEPCSMCAGAMVLARIEKLVFALQDPKTGACGSVFNLVEDARLNHQVQVVSGVRCQESLTLLRTFFSLQRKSPKYQRQKESPK